MELKYKIQYNKLVDMQLIMAPTECVQLNHWIKANDHNYMPEESLSKKLFNETEVLSVGEHWNTDIMYRLKCLRDTTMNESDSIFKDLRDINKFIAKTQVQLETKRAKHAANLRKLLVPSALVLMIVDVIWLNNTRNLIKSTSIWLQFVKIIGVIYAAAVGTLTIFAIISKTMEWIDKLNTNQETYAPDK